jgi:enoyl-[acyl-carrier protein] reductase I
LPHIWLNVVDLPADQQITTPDFNRALYAGPSGFTCGRAVPPAMSAGGPDRPATTAWLRGGSRSDHGLNPSSRSGIVNGEPRRCGWCGVRVSRISKAIAMGLMDGKQGVVLGIANELSIAWSIAQELHAAGATVGYTHLPDKDPERPKNRNKVARLVEPLGSKFLIPCDVSSDAQLDETFATIGAQFGKIDFLVHSIAFAPPADLTGPVYNSSRDGFKLAMDISCYSLIAMCKRARPILNKGGSILALTYLGGEAVIPGYNLMGLCKAALENAVGYLASELGPEGLRVNCISAGPIRTLSIKGVAGSDKMFTLYDIAAPLRRNVTAGEVGKAALFLLSDMASGISAETLHVDAGYHIMGAPPQEAGSLGSDA